MDQTESPSPRRLTGAEPDTGARPSGDEQSDSGPAAQPPAPAGPAPDADRQEGEGWVPV